MINNSFSPTYRLRKSTDFAPVYRRSKRFSAGKLTLLCKANNLSYPRLGLSIGRKKVRRAVDRNRIKRLTREVFRHHKKLIGGVDMILIAGKMPKNVDRVEVKQWLDELMKQLIAYYES